MLESISQIAIYLNSAPALACSIITKISSAQVDIQAHCKKINKYLLLATVLVLASVYFCPLSMSVMIYGIKILFAKTFRIIFFVSLSWV